MAGITLVYVFGDNGIIKLAQEAKEKTEQGMQNEQEDIENLVNMLKEESGRGGSGGTTNLPDEPDPPTPTEPTISNASTATHTGTEIAYTWEQMNKIAEAIAKSESVTNETTEVKVMVDGTELTIGVGDIARVDYITTPATETTEATTESRRVRVLGFKHDDLVKTGVETYGNGAVGNKASISFEFYDLMTGNAYKSMNSSDTNSGGWAATQMRKDLNGYTTSEDAQSGVIGGLGANLSNKSYIKQVKKSYIKVYDNANSIYQDNDSTKGKKYTQDYLWLLSCSEVVNSGYRTGMYAYAKTTEGSQYKYYQGVEKDGSWRGENGGREKYNASGHAYVWWLRSPYFENSSDFCGIYGNGEALNLGIASYPNGVAPGFAI